MIHLHQKYLSLMNAASEAGAPSGLLRSCFCILSLARAIDFDCANRLAKYDLTEGKFVLLFFLAQHPKGLSPSQLAQLAGVTKATVTGLSDGLVKIGLVKRSTDVGDRRSLTIELTPKGKRVAAEVVQAHGAWIASLFQNCSSKDLKMLEKILGLIWFQTDDGKRSPSALKPKVKESAI